MSLSFSFFLSQIIGDASTFVFSVVILCITIWGILGYLIPYTAIRNTASLMSGFAVTVGILGTFWGIAIGLMSFDVENIDSSVPHLLAGMKIAFLTSIVGMTASLLIKLFQAMFGTREKNGTTTPGDIFAALVSIRRYKVILWQCA